MTENIGNTDRIIRFNAGILVLGLGMYFQSWWGLVGVALVVTAVLRFCPAYLPLGLNTR